MSISIFDTEITLCCTPPLIIILLSTSSLPFVHMKFLSYLGRTLRPMFSQFLVIQPVSVNKSCYCRLKACLFSYVPQTLASPLYLPRLSSGTCSIASTTVHSLLDTPHDTTFAAIGSKQHVLPAAIFAICLPCPSATSFVVPGKTPA